jgi:hypothetical protein
MTDPTPNAPVPTPLSPAQAIVQAFDDRYELLGPLEDDWQEQCIAAALGALADQVVPDEGVWIGGGDLAMTRFYQRKRTRKQLLAIATELENHP